MKCEYFGKCGSCILDLNYKNQLEIKKNKIQKLFKEFDIKDFEVFQSKESHFRARAEFRFFKDSFAMHSIDNSLFPIEACPIVLEPIFSLMPKLLEEIRKSTILKEKLYAIEFLSSLNKDTLVTLIYHKKLDEAWQDEALRVSNCLNISIVGRSRKQKVVIKKDYAVEKLKIFNKDYSYIHQEATFTQPNPYINQKMIEWAKDASRDFGGDFLELYCGSGNFTLPLSENFGRVLATEVSKNSIKTAIKNSELNSIENIKFVRLSSEEFVKAFNKEREFNRLKQANIDLDGYNFSTVLIDPPRAGLDETTRDLIKNFKNIIYISCNPNTLFRDLKDITKTHTIKRFAMFDQFPYTPHIESAVLLVRH